MRNKGFTLIEILVVIGIFAIIAAFGMTTNLSAFTTATIQSEESKIVSALERARSRAMANMFNTAHGVCYIAPNYVIFREKDAHCVFGTSTNELIPANTNIATASSFPFTPVVFNQLSGNVTDAVITIKINNAGAINW